MPKLERWIIASRNVSALDDETQRKLMDWGAHTAGGWKTVHQHVLVNYNNKEQIESYMTSRGYEVHPVSDPSFFHPEPYEQFKTHDLDAAEKIQEYSREQTAIEQSYGHLESAPPTELLSDRYATIVKENSEKIIHLWLREVYANHTTANLRDVDRNELASKVGIVMRLLTGWLETKNSNADVELFFGAWGRELRRGPLKLHEVLSGLSLLRKQVFLFTEQRGQAKRDSSIDIYRIMEFSRRLVIFFDKATYFTARGYDC